MSRFLRYWLVMLMLDNLLCARFCFAPCVFGWLGYVVVGCVMLGMNRYPPREEGMRSMHLTPENELVPVITTKRNMDILIYGRPDRPVCVVRSSVRPFVRLSVCPSVHLSVCPPLSASVRLCPFPPVCPSIRLCPSVCLSVRPFVRSSVCPFVRLSVCPSVRLSVCPFVRLSVCTVVRLCCLSVCLCLSVRLSVRLCLSSNPKLNWPNIIMPHSGYFKRNNT